MQQSLNNQYLRHKRPAAWLAALLIAVLVTAPARAAIDNTSFAPKVDFPTAHNPFSVVVGDLDGDGKLDLVTANGGDYSASVLRNTSTSGSVSFAAKVDFPIDRPIHSVAVGDLDGDGKRDLAVASYFGVSVLRNMSTSGNVAFAAKVDFPIGYASMRVAVGDLDGDGKLDLAVANGGGSSVSVLRNTSTSGSVSFAAKVDFPTGGYPYSVAVGDLDGDGKRDLAVANRFSNSISVLRNTSTSGSLDSASFAAKVDFPTAEGPESVAVDDLDGDGKLDLAVSYGGSNNVSVLRNTSTSGSLNNTSFAPKVDFPTGTTPNSVAVGDLDGDGKRDLATANYGSDSVSVLRNSTSAPEIDVTGNGVSIAYNDTTPSTSDGTDFGPAEVNGFLKDSLFFIDNVGNGQLDIDDITLSGTGKDEFFVAFAGGEPPASVPPNNAPQDGFAFVIEFLPRTPGLHEATVSIANNDADESPFTFAIQGTGTSADSDNDGVPDTSDNCPTVANSGQANFDNDAQGDACDSDDDNDDLSDSQEATHGTDPRDADSDNDGVNDGLEVQNGTNPLVSTPTLHIANANLDASAGSFDVPVVFSSNGPSIASVGFSLDYPESCLSYVSVSGLPSGFIDSIFHDAGDLDGELDIRLSDESAPITALPDGTLLTVNFTVKPACITIDGTTTDVTVNFSSAPAASFGNLTGEDVSGTTSNGTLTLEFNATPTDISLSPSSIAENSANGPDVGSLSTADLNPLDSHSYQLVTGVGDSDNVSFTIDGATLKSAASFNFESKSSYTVRIGTTDNGGLNGSFEKSLTITVNDVNDAPVARDDEVDPLTTVVVGSASTDISVLVNDTDEDTGASLSVAAATDPAAGSVTHASNTVTFSAPNSNGSASFTYQASDGTVNSNSATVTVNHVKNDLRGDCNSNGSVTAADFIAIVLELFDGKSDPQHAGKPAWWRIYAGGYAGSPLGCDANASQNGSDHSSDSVAAGDIICTVLVFFGNSSCTQPGVAAAAESANATLSAPQAQAAAAGSTTEVGVTLATAGQPLAAVAFALVLDPQAVSLDLTDADGDGVPDAVKVNAPASMSRSVTWNAASHQLEVALFGVSLPLPTLTDGTLVSVTLAVAADAPAGSSPLTLAQVSLGNDEGRDVAVTAVDGSLAIAGNNAGTVKVHLPLVAR